METELEQLDDNRVRLSVEVPGHDVRHAVDHAAQDLAASVRVPGFRKGKVPMQVLINRVGRERLYTEAVESHIGGWFRNAAAASRIRPVEQPEYGYDLPEDPDDSWRFTATVVVQPPTQVADWTQVEVPYAEPEVPQELVDRELERLQRFVAELVPVERPAREGDTLVIDVVSPSGEAQRDTVVELGRARLVEEIEAALVGMSAGETKTVTYELADGSEATVDLTLKDVKEPVLPPLADDLARAASEFDTLDELREDLEAQLRRQLASELDERFREQAVDSLVEASNVHVAGRLVDARAAELWHGLQHSLERRGIDPELYLQVTDQTGDQLVERLRAEAQQSIARELVLEAAADKLELQVADGELEAFVREQAAEEGQDDADEIIQRLQASGRWEQLRADLRLRSTLDQIVSEVQRIPVELAAAREKLWTPEKESPETPAKLWTPSSKEPA